MKAAKKLILYFFLIILLFGCRKEKKDVLPPDINITSPTENQLVYIPDTITVMAEITDDSPLTEVKVNIVDDNLVPVLPSLIYHPMQSTYQVNIDYPVDDVMLTSGYYYVHVYASDGTNTKNDYRKIYINEIPKRFLYVAAVTRVNYNTLQVMKIDSVYNATSMFIFNSDYSASDVNSKNQLLYIAGNYFGNVNAYDLTNNTLAWSIPALINPPFPCFTNIYYNGTYALVSNYNGTIKGYDKSGALKYSLNTPAGSYPGKLYPHNQYLFSELTMVSGGSKSIAVYYYSTSYLMQQLPVTYSVVDFYSKDDDDVFVFVNAAGQGMMKIYSITDNNVWQPIVIPTGKIYSVAQIDADHYLIAHDNGIYSYNYSLNSLVPFIPGLQADKIKYNSLTGEVYASHAKTISVYDYPSASLVNSVVLSDTICDFHLVFNK